MTRDLAVTALSGPTCEGGRAQLQALVTGGLGPYHFRWAPADGLDDPTSATPIAGAGAVDSYTVTVIDQQFLEASSTTAIVRAVPPEPLVTFRKGGELSCEGDLVELETSELTGEGWLVVDASWTRGDGAPLSGLASGALLPKDGERVRLDVTYGQGCSATREVLLRVRQRPSLTVSFVSGGMTICAGDQVELVAAATDADGSPVERFEWDFDDDPMTVEASSSSSGPFVPAGPPARVTAIDAYGCGTFVNTPVELIPLPTPVVGYAEGAPEVCEGRPITLDAAGSRDSFGAPVVDYEWDLDGDWGSVDGTGPRAPTLVATGSHDVRLRVRDALGCAGVLGLTVKGRAPPTARIDFLEGGPRVCTGERFVVSSKASTDANGRPVVRHEWDVDGDGRTDWNLARLAGTPRAPHRTSFVLTVTDDLGCRSGTQVEFTADPLPVVDAGPERRVALGGSVSLLGAVSGGTPGYGLAWSPAGTVTDLAVAQPRANPSSTTTYTLVATDVNGCKGSDVVRVEVLPPLTVDAGRDATHCLLDETGIPLSATPSGGVGALRFRWTASPACAGCIASADTAAPTVDPRVDTTFTVTVTDENGTTATDSVFVRSIDHLTVDAGLDRAIDRAGSTRLGTTAVSGFSYAWSCDRPTCGLSDPAAAEPLASPEGTTTYTVNVANGTRCVGSDSVLVAAPAQILGAMPSEGFDRWPRDAPLWVVFDADLDVASLDGNVYLLDPADGLHIFMRHEYDAANRMLVIFPLDVCEPGCTGEKAYWNNREYLLVLKGGPGGVTSAGPIPMTLYNDLTLRYVASSGGDGAAPQLVHRRPAQNASNVPRETLVVMKFGEHVDPRSVNAQTFWVEGVRGSVSYDIRTRQAFFRPDAPLDPNSPYTVRVDGVTDARSGLTRTNVVTTSWSFTTGSALDTTPPTVTAFTPVNGDTSWDVAAPPQVRFSEPLDIATVGQLRLVDESTGAPVAAEVAWDDASLTATLSPRTFLEPGRTFRLEGSGVRDFSGNALGSAISRLTTKSARFAERFEGGTAGWSLAAPWGTDVQAASFGRYGLSDSPGGTYGSSVAAAARAPRFDVAGLTSVTMTLWGRRTLGSTDAVVIEYSPDASTWTTAARLTGCRGWAREDYVLPTSGRSSLYVRFRLESDAAVQLDGWFIDELVVR